MNFRKLFLVLGIFLAHTCSGFADTSNENEQAIGRFLMSNRVVNNKIYLNPESLFLTSNQILLNMEGHFLPIGNLSADIEGIFVTIEEIVRAVQKPSWMCRCGRVNSMDERWCSRCGASWNQ